MGPSYLHFDDFYSLVKEHFSFLKEEGYVEQTFEKGHGRFYRLMFTNKKLIICIQYGVAPNFLEVLFRKDDDVLQTNQYEVDDMLGLTYYFTARGFTGELYSAILPGVIGFESSLKAISYLVRTFAMDIVRGNEWITNKMVREGFRY